MKKHKRILRHLSKDIRYRIIEGIGSKLHVRVQNILEAELLFDLSLDADQYGGHVWASLKGGQ